MNLSRERGACVRLKRECTNVLLLKRPRIARKYSEYRLVHGRQDFTVNRHRAVLARFCTEPRVGRALTVTSLVVSATSATYIRNGTRAREKCVRAFLARFDARRRKREKSDPSEERSTGGVGFAGGSSFREVFLSPGPLNTVYVQGRFTEARVNRPARVDLTEGSRG